MKDNILIIIIGMMLVTYIPRLIPMVTLSERPMPPLIRRILLYIPYTALGALIIPGALKATPEMPLASAVGLAAAAVFAWFRGGMILPVLASITAAFVALNIA